jgi:hypothetical protein
MASLRKTIYRFKQGLMIEWNRFMPTCFLTCEGCGTRQPSVVEAEAAVHLQAGKTLPKHCLVCRTTTDWALAFVDRRNGIDRRNPDPNTGLGVADRRTGRDRRGGGTPDEHAGH